MDVNDVTPMDIELPAPYPQEILVSHLTVPEDLRQARNRRKKVSQWENGRTVLQSSLGPRCSGCERGM